MLDRKPVTVNTEAFDDWEIIPEDDFDVFETPETKNVLQRMTATLKAIITYALHMLGNPEATPEDFTLLRQNRLYDHGNKRFIHILEQAHKSLRVEPDGKVPLMQLSRLLNGDSFGLSAPLSKEVRQCIQNLADIRIMADMDDDTFIEIQSQLPEFILMQGPAYRPLTLHAGHKGKIRCVLAPEISTFLLQKQVDDYTLDTLEEMLGTLAQLAVELTCTRDNRFQDWLSSPDSFNLNSFFRSSESRKEAMPAVLNAVLQIIAPLAFLQHQEHFSKLMHLVLLLVQTGLLRAREDLIRLYTKPHQDQGSDKPVTIPREEKRQGFFHEKARSIELSELQKPASATVRPEKK